MSFDTKGLCSKVTSGQIPQPAAQRSIASGGTRHALFEMSRYKGQLKASRTEAEIPHHVDVTVPPGGLGTRLDAMYDFHAQHGIKPQRGHGTHTADGAVIRWCFADASLAAAFVSKFGT